MPIFSRPTVFISNCLGFEDCRFDGGIIHSEFVERLLPYVDVIRTCPEMAIGLGSPRDAIRLIKNENDEVRLVSSYKGEDRTDEMNRFVYGYLSSLDGNRIDGFILKAKSPTCGIDDVKVYGGIQKAPVLNAKQPGFFGGRVAELFPNHPKETEMRLTSFKIRDRFYTELFTLAYFREIRSGLRMKHLVDFHAKNKYLFMTYNQNTLKQMGRIVANHDQLSTDTVFKDYENTLRTLLSKEPSQKNRINVLTHIYGYFKKDVTAEEKEYYFEVLDDYLNGQAIYANVLTILKGWAVRFQQAYLLQQTIFQPYPKDLVNLIDSGKTI